MNSSLNLYKPALGRNSLCHIRMGNGTYHVTMSFESYRSRRTKLNQANIHYQTEYIADIIDHITICKYLRFKLERWSPIT